MVRAQAGATLVLLVALVATAAGGVRVVGEEDQEAQAVRAAARQFLEKLNTGDSAGARSLAGAADSQLEFIGAYARLLGAATTLHQSVVGRFQIEPSAQVTLDNQLLPKRLELLGRRLVSLDGDQARLAHLGPLDPGLDLRKSQGGWRVTGIWDETRDITKFQAYVRNYTDCAADLRSRVISGAFSNPYAPLVELNRRTIEKYLEWLSSTAVSRPPTTAQAVRAIPANPQQLRELFGDRFASPGVKRLIGSFSSPPYVYQGTPHFLLVSAADGISIQFQSLEGPLTGFGLSGPGFEGSVGYSGPLPSGLDFRDRRRDVERKLGPPPRSHGGRDTHYTSHYPSLGLSIEYATNDARDPNALMGRIDVRPTGQPADTRRPGAARLQMRLIIEQQEQAGEETESLPDPQNLSGPKLNVSKRVIVGDEDVERGYIGSTGRGPGRAAFLTLTDQGASRLQAATTQNIGRRIAIMFDGQVLMAPVIRSGIAKDVQVDFGGGTSAEASAVMAGKFQEFFEERHARVNSLSPTDPSGSPSDPGR